MTDKKETAIGSENNEAAVEVVQEQSTPSQAPKQGARPREVKRLAFHVPEAWPHPVVICDVFKEMDDILKKHLIVTPEERWTIILWIVFSYAPRRFRHSPRLLVTSPQMQCGKTTLLSILAALAYKALHVSHLTPATLFRMLDKERPTIIADEADTYIHGDENMRNVLNNGHTRDGSWVMRCDGDQNDVRLFDAYGAMVIGQIGSPPDTVMDRSIAIMMKRKKPSEKTLPFLSQDDDTVKVCREIQAKLMRWTTDHANDLTKAAMQLPDFLNNRNADKWHPLFAIAELAGDPWLWRVEQAARWAVSMDNPDDAELSSQLLADIRMVFKMAGTQAMMTAALLHELKALDDRPWGTLNNGKPMDARKMSDFLRPFGICPQNIRFANSGQKKGYVLADFTDAFERYLKP